MNTRWSTLLAALGLTLLALGSGRAAHAASVTGQGTIVANSGDVLWFTVAADSHGGGAVLVRIGADQIVFAVTPVIFTQYKAVLDVVVKQSTTWVFPPGYTSRFVFYDYGTTDDAFISAEWSSSSADTIASGNITIRP
jgi:hypothetical protein